MPRHARKRPKHLGAKLLAIRQHLHLSQSQLALRLGFEASYNRISQYESGAREPNLLVLLRYSQLVGLHLETIINDRVDLEQFQDELSNES